MLIYISSVWVLMGACESRGIPGAKWNSSKCLYIGKKYTMYVCVLLSAVQRETLKGTGLK